jgi:hypothetical protein
MHQPSLSIRNVLARLFAPLVLLGAAQAQAQNKFIFPIDGPQMGTPSLGAGTAVATLDTTTGQVTVNGTFSGLLGDLLAVHIHGPALPGFHAPVKLVLDYSGTTSGTISGSDIATPQGIQDMLSGLYYVVMHTAAYGGGELRGQIVTPANTTPYGSGINPAGSLVALSGTPTVPSTVTLGIDNPSASQGAPGLGLLFASLAPDALLQLSGTGLLLPGLGMSGPFGELLIDLQGPNPFLTLSASGWAGPGSPLAIPLSVPNNLSLVGRTIYLQGALFADGRFTLTNGLRLYFGQ